MLTGSKWTEEDLRPVLSRLRACVGLHVSGPFGLESAKALIASDCVPRLEACELDLTPDARAALVAAGLDAAAAKQRGSAARGYSIRV
ncbi:hypothetical protein [Nannocystis pusilla]|uniref:hypothetical protein n=1 Tax=Nannocystis pusilla TaxID=889268 RepID=UPI003B79D191